MPARPKNDSDVSEDESENELMQSASDDEESDEEESDDDEESDDEESDDDNEDLTLRWKGEAGDSNENDSDDSGEEEDDDEEDDESDDEDESDENEGKNRAAYKRVGMQGNDSDDESGDESDDEDGEESDDEEESDEDSDDSDEIAAGKLLKNNKNQLANVKEQKQNAKKGANLVNEKVINSKVEKKPTPKLEKTPAAKVEKNEKTKKGKPELEKKETKKKVPFEQTTEDLKEKYAKKRGKSLYIRFPKRLPTDQAELEKYIKGICNRVITVRRPRQPSARFCLVDFDNVEDCKKAYKEIRQIDVDGKRLHVQVPRTDSEDFIEELMDRRRKKLKELRAKKKLRKSLGPKETEKKEKVFTSAITVRNIPINASVEEVKNHFPNAVEFKLFYAKKPQETNWAVVTLPTTQDATKARRQNIVIGDNKLSLSFVGQQKNKKKNKKQKPKSSNDTNKEEEKKEVPTSSEKNEKKKEKRKSDGADDKQDQSKKVKRDSEDSPVKQDFSQKTKKLKFGKPFKKEHKIQNEQQEDKQKNKEAKNINNGNAKPFVKNDNSFEKKNKNSFEKQNKQQKLHSGGPEIKNNEQKHIKFGKKFGNKDKGFQNQHKKKNFKGDFPKGRNESRKGNFHMKAMRS